MNSFAVNGLCRVCFTAYLMCISHRSVNAMSFQEPPSGARFEVASVRPVKTCGLSSMGPLDTARFTASNVTLKLLIEIAFHVDGDKVHSKLPWLATACYDIDAMTAGEQKLNQSNLELLLQDLLKERFGVMVHRESNLSATYDLIVKGGSAGPSQSKNVKPFMYFFQDRIRGEALSMSAIAGALSHYVERPVMDKTGLNGTFDIDLRFAPLEAHDSPLPSLAEALDETMGLRLIKGKKEPLESLSVDAARRDPTPD